MMTFRTRYYGIFIYTDGHHWWILSNGNGEEDYLGTNGFTDIQIERFREAVKNY